VDKSLEQVRNRHRFFGIAAASIAVGALVAASAAAQSADDLTPPSGYRKWFHVNTMIVDKGSPLFEAIGGMHNVHINSVGEPALRKGGPYPDGAVFLTDLHDYALVDGFLRGRRAKRSVRDGKGLKEVCLDRWVGLSVLGRRRS
jgi:hypothetical protein